MEADEKEEAKSNESGKEATENKTETKKNEEKKQEAVKVKYPWEEAKEHWETILKVLKDPIETPSQLEDIIQFASKGRKPNFFSFHFKQNENKNEKTEFFAETLPFLQKLVLRSQEILPAELPLQLPGQNVTTVLTREQVACILANTFFGTLTFYRPASYPGVPFPDLDFEYFFSGRFLAQMKCMLHYFKRICKQMPQGKLIVKRAVLTSVDAPKWTKSSKKVRSPVSISAQGTIEDSNAESHVDFANEYIGGGVLQGGNVQEEILFLVKPECLVTLLFCAKMWPHEAILITGAERFSAYTGYGFSFDWGGDFQDNQVARDSEGTILRSIIAIDAIVAGPSLHQFQEKYFTRDLNKAFIGFSAPEKTSKIATGNWGCGAFGGDKRLKALQQILAASEAERDLLYFTFKDEKLEADIQAFSQFLTAKQLTVGELTSFYLNNVKQFLEDSSGNILQFLMDQLDK